MKKPFIVFLLCALLGIQTSFSQDLEPVKWDLTVDTLGNDEYSLKFTAKVIDHWYLYSMDVPEFGPNPTSFYFDTSDSYEFLGAITEDGTDVKEGFDVVFEMDVKKFAYEAWFTQKIKVLDKGEIIKGTFEYQTCDDEKCLFPDPTFFEFNPTTGEVYIGGEKLDTSAEVSDTELDREAIDLDNPRKDCGFEDRSTEGKGIWAVFLLGFGGGLIALLTPCVFPMIPLTVSFFTKGSENKKKGLMKAFMYGFFIFLVYVLFSLPFHLMDSLNPDILNEISTNTYLNIGFFVIFIVFAISFFGYFEISLPSSITNKASSAEGVGGIIGIFFMAVTLALVSFSCTGPILGSLLAGALSTDGGAMQLSAGFAGFGLALALPFAVFAAFPGLMSSLPKSGGWLNTVKVVLGFIELALAVKFLSNADLVENWGILKIEVFLGLWIIIFIALAIYLLGKIKFPHDSPIKKLGIPRIVLAVVSVAFVVYLGTGFMYNSDTKTFKSLKLLSGLAPSSGYSWIYPSDCPQSFNCYKDYFDALEYAKEQNKPILIDFTGKACVNCRKVEENIWVEDKVDVIIRNDYVLVSLYVDYKKALPEELIVLKPNGDKRKLKTVGNMWSHFQSTNFASSTQPLYCLISPDEELLTTPIGYSGDLTPEKYAQFLQCGLDAFEEIKAEK